MDDGDDDKLVVSWIVPISEDVASNDKLARAPAPACPDHLDQTGLCNPGRATPNGRHQMLCRERVVSRDVLADRLQLVSRSLQE
jgi:hypothetical protein